MTKSSRLRQYFYCLETATASRIIPTTKCHVGIRTSSVVGFFLVPKAINDRPLLQE